MSLIRTGKGGVVESDTVAVAYQQKRKPMVERAACGGSRGENYELQLRASASAASFKL